MLPIESPAFLNLYSVILSMNFRMGDEGFYVPLKKASWF